MAGVAQLVERWFVVPVVVGSNPVTRPIKFNPTKVGFNFTRSGRVRTEGSTKKQILQAQHSEIVAIWKGDHPTFGEWEYTARSPAPYLMNTPLNHVVKGVSY